MAATAVTPEASPFPLDTRCTKCHRYLLRHARAKRGYSGRWRHDGCAQAPEPSGAEFAELAGVLMDTQPWPRVLTLRARLAEVTDELERLEGATAQVPHQRPRRIDDVGGGRARLQQLRHRAETISTALDDEQAWKAGRLAAEWADGL